MSEDMQSSDRQPSTPATGQAALREATGIVRAAWCRARVPGPANGPDAAPAGAASGSAPGPAVLLIDPSGTVLAANDAAQHLTGYPLAQLAGLPYAALFSSEDVATGRPAQLLGRAVREQCADTGWRVRADGARVYVAALLAAQRDAAGRLYGIIEVASPT